MKRVVVTGIGLVTPLGVGHEATWSGLVEGRTGIGPVTLFDAQSLRTRLGGEVRDFQPKEFITNRRTLRMMTRGDQLAFAGAVLAVRDSGLDTAALDGDRTGLFVGGNKEVCDPTLVADAALAARDADGTMDVGRFGELAPRLIPPLFFVEGLPAASLFYISEAYGLKGANTFFAGTAEVGAVAIGTAYRAVRRGEVDVALAGGFDDAVSWWAMTKLEALGVMTERNELGAAAYSPYDRDRSGTLVGEGAAFLVLEEVEAAVRRGARIYAEVTGFGSGLDAGQVLTPDPEGGALTLAMRGALREAGTPADSLQYLVTHGSATKTGDTSEVRAIRTALGDAADQVAASCIKPATGHLVGGAGALNAAVLALAVYHQTLPPMLHLQNPDPACQLDWVTGEARRTQVENGLALARGLEGQNIALAMRRA